MRSQKQHVIRGFKTTSQQTADRLRGRGIALCLMKNKMIPLEHQCKECNQFFYPKSEQDEHTKKEQSDCC